MVPLALPPIADGAQATTALLGHRRSPTSVRAWTKLDGDANDDAGDADRRA